MGWWVNFTDGSAGCVEFPKGLSPMKRAEFIEELPTANGRKVQEIRPLPYPANPRLNRPDIFGTDGVNYGPCPSFCHRPNECAGKSSCPRSPSCVD